MSRFGLACHRKRMVEIKAVTNDEGMTKISTQDNVTRMFLISACKKCAERRPTKRTEVQLPISRETQKIRTRQYYRHVQLYMWAYALQLLYKWRKS